MAFILWEREDEKRCFGNRGIRNSKGRNCEIGANIVKFLPQNHAQHEYHFFANAAACCQFDYRGLQPKNNTKRNATMILKYLS